jgi:hypothetical protein
VDMTITCSSDEPRFKMLDIRSSCTMPTFMLPVWRSVEMESGRNPAEEQGRRRTSRSYKRRSRRRR